MSGVPKQCNNSMCARAVCVALRVQIVILCAVLCVCHSRYVSFSLCVQLVLE